MRKRHVNDRPGAGFGGSPPTLRAELLESYQNIIRSFIERRWEPSELNGGKFAEVVYSIASGAITGNMPDRARKPKNMVDACRGLETKPANPNLVGNKSLRVYIPRALVFLYDIRNQRGVGHVGGDVNPNSLDAAVVVAVANWTMAELVRIFHDVSTKEAQDTVDALVERRSPLIWEVEPGGPKRVLKPGLDGKDQVLLLLYHSTGWVPAVSLFNWVEHKNLTQFRDKVLRPLHKLRLIEFDARADQAKISPLGTSDVEQRLLNSGL